MPVDFHVHLEEGPYTFSWLTKTILAMDEFTENNQIIGSKARLLSQMERLQNRLSDGCYSEEWLHLYLKKAQQLGLKQVGIVDHLYRFQETKDYFEKYVNINPNDEIGLLQQAWLSNVMTERLDHFVDFILDAQKKWEKQGVSLRLGMEADYFPGGENELRELLDGYPWDFIIGSTHFLNGWGFDNPETIHRFSQGDIKEQYDKFFQAVEKMIRSQMFDFVAHLDNFKVFNYVVKDPAFNSYWHERIADALIETDTATEINAGLYYRYPVKEMCPGPKFLNVLAKKGVSFTLSSDSHYPSDLGKYIFDNMEALKNLGVHEIATFKQRQREMMQIDSLQTVYK